MSFLDKLKQAASTASVAATNAAEVAVKQTKTAAAVGKVKLAIAGEEDKLKKAYTELGRLFYRDYEAQAEAEMEEYQPWIDKAADAKDAIARLTAELETIKAENAKKEVPGEVVEEPAEDTSIYVDFDEAEPAPVVETEAPAEESAAEEKDPVEETAESASVEEPVEEPTPTVGTLYVDISGQE